MPIRLDDGRGALQRTRARGRTPLIIVIDCGSDPDDTKSLVIAATLHLRRRVRLLAVVANSGAQPRARARLARCVLDHVGVRDVPVGVGLMGQAYTASLHEYALDGYENVAEQRLLDGGALLVRVLRGARRRSVRVVLISSLRDFADVCIAHPRLIKDKVHTVAIQDGLERDMHVPADESAAWSLDSSVNNCFDVEGM